MSKVSNVCIHLQRREAGVLKEFLPEKFEYVLFVPLTPVQVSPVRNETHEK